MDLFLLMRETVPVYDNFDKTHAMSFSTEQFFRKSPKDRKKRDIVQKRREMGGRRLMNSLTSGQSINMNFSAKKEAPMKRGILNRVRC
jgi:hypothetical protein